MQEQLITFETAKLAKEKGFNIPSWYYDERNENKEFRHNLMFKTNKELNGFQYSCPTQSLLRKWLREKHNCHISVDIEYESDKWRVNIMGVNKWEWELSGLSERYLFQYYEEALEEGLQKALKLI